MNVMTVDGYHAKIEFDEELDFFRGEILGLMAEQISMGKHPRSCALNSRSLCRFFWMSAKKKESNPESNFRGNSI